MWKFSNFWKLGWKLAGKKVNFCSFGVVLKEVHFLSFSAKFSTQEISSNFKKKIEKCWNWCQRKFIFRGLNMIEYLSDLNEKWMVRKVNFCSFGHVWSRFGKSSIFFFFCKYSSPENFVEFQEISENSENGVRETLFSD